ncbi:hypothetical protein Cgig2_012047 [Carnegiea gigantea]|uniref:Uncharacterized protein n=1 Tax=Carnegiea gigantea TaxID=171969 RepID=A0A9Q1QMP3_9CARY|nr:hypothetical protein Cgig2_012047 [Carnegiea gigantea]
MALFAMYVEAVSVLPQLRIMQNAELHYELSFGLSLSLNKTNKISADIRLYEFYWYTVIDILGDQLHQILNGRTEPFTSHYAFSLDVARFLGCAHWFIQIVKTKGQYLLFIELGHVWLLMLLLSKAVQTFILADFCHYYVKSVMEGEFLMKLPSVV